MPVLPCVECEGWGILTCGFREGCRCVRFTAKISISRGLKGRDREISRVVGDCMQMSPAAQPVSAFELVFIIVILGAGGVY